MCSAPYIYRYPYIDHSKNESNTLFGVIEIQTRYSPPTNVTCQRNGEIVVAYPCMKKDGYEVMQVITDRYRSYYTTYILIRTACDLLGRNTYTCKVENYAGSHSRNIYTKMEGMIIILRFNIYIYICSRQVCVCQHTYCSQNICWCIDYATHSREHFRT